MFARAAIDATGPSFARVQMDGVDHTITGTSVDICSRSFGIDRVVAAAWRDLEA